MYKLKLFAEVARPFVRLTGGHNLAVSSAGILQCRHVSTPATSVIAEPFLNGTSSTYVEEMYDAWLADPKSVHKVDMFY